MLVDIFVLADSAADARRIAHEVQRGLTFERTYAIEADADSIRGWADGWAAAHPFRKVSRVIQSGRFGYRVSGEVR
jgi:hypothetical protein